MWASAKLLILWLPDNILSAIKLWYSFNRFFLKKLKCDIVVLKLWSDQTMVLLQQIPSRAHSICMPSYNLHIHSGSSGVLKPIHGFRINSSSSRCRFRARTEYQIFQPWLWELWWKGLPLQLRVKQLFFPEGNTVLFCFLFGVLT